VLGRSYEEWLWVGVFLIAIGCIPEVGSAVKGVLKGLIRFLQDAAKKAGDLSPAQLKRIWEDLLKILNHLGISQGNAHRWLKEMPGRLDGWMDKAAAKVKGGLDSIREMMDKAQTYARFLRDRGLLSSQKAQQVLDRVQRYKTAAARAYKRLDEMKARVNKWIKDQISGVLDGKHTVEKGGTPNTPAKNGGSNVHKQEAAEPPEILTPKQLERTRPSRAPDPNAKPRGKRTEINPKNDAATTGSLKAENDSADALAKSGYDIEQNPAPRPGSTRNPDYKIEGKYFDCYAPQSANKSPRGIWSEIDQSKVNPIGKDQQADRIVLNLDKWEGDTGALKKQFDEHPMSNLKEVMVVKDGKVTPFWP
jgi:hypothetical protein